MRAFHALWALDGRSLYLINQAYIVLLKKKNDASEITGFQPISLIHSFAKLFTKVLATRLAPLMPQLVWQNQSAFIQGRMIHEKFPGSATHSKTLGPKEETLLSRLILPRPLTQLTGRSFSRCLSTWVSLIDGLIGFHYFSPRPAPR